MKTHSLFAALLSAVVLTSGTALAGSSFSYTGSWPVKVRMPPHFADTDCLVLTDNGTAGSPHSGPVSASGDMTGDLSGTFQVVKGLLVVNLESGSGTGEVVWITFIGHAHDGQIGAGVFNEPGYFPVEPLTFGQKGGC
ncbi:MAG TPA: hypothetical protein VKR31_16320 [Rhizomicrobium sp.]|nr:hypothetical protein [Rhizomicrobium sp.]